VSEKLPRDIDLATAAEQSSEEDEAQEGNVLDSQQHASDPAEHNAMHVVDDDNREPDLDGLLEEILVQKVRCDFFFQAEDGIRDLSL